MLSSRKLQPMKTKLLLVLALFPPATYIGLFTATPMPYSPVMDYVVLHGPEYGQEVSESAAWVALSQRTLHGDMNAFTSNTITTWTVPEPTNPDSFATDNPYP